MKGDTFLLLPTQLVYDSHTSTCWSLVCVTMFICVYSGTSLKGLSELRTQYKNLPIKDKFCSPNGTMLIHFTSERGKPLYNSKNDPEMASPKVSIIKRFHCIYKCLCTAAIHIEGRQAYIPHIEYLNIRWTASCPALFSSCALTMQC